MDRIDTIRTYDIHDVMPVIYSTIPAETADSYAAEAAASRFYNIAELQDRAAQPGRTSLAADFLATAQFLLGGPSSDLEDMQPLEARAHLAMGHHTGGKRCVHKFPRPLRGPILVTA